MPYVYYDPNDSVVAIHNVPRFGRHNQISKIVSSTKAEQVDYILGALYLPALMFTIYVYWVVIILLFKCMGKKRVGFLSGSNFSFKDMTSGADLRQKGHGGLKPAIIRSFFLFSASLILLFCLLLATEGIANFENTFVTIQKSISEIRAIINNSIQITTSLRRVGYDTMSLKDTVVDNLDDFCPGAGPKDVMGAIDTDALIKQLDELTGLLVGKSGSVRSTLQGILEVVTSSLVHIDEWTDWGWTPILLVFPYIILISLFIIGTSMSWLDIAGRRLQFTETWIAQPLLVILTTLCLVVTCVIFFITILNADICLGGNDFLKGPEITLQEVLRERNIDKEELIFKIIVYYTMGCEIEDPFSFVDSYKTDLNDAISKLRTYEDTINSVGVDTLSKICEKDISHLVGVLGPLASNLEELLQNVGRIFDLVKCSAVNELYVQVTHELLCTYSTNSLTYLFVSLLLITVCSMIMITLRASWLENGAIEYSLCYEEDDEETTDSRSVNSNDSGSDQSQSTVSDLDEESHANSSRSESPIDIAHDDDLFPCSKKSHTVRFNIKDSFRSNYSTSETLSSSGEISSSGALTVKSDSDKNLIDIENQLESVKDNFNDQDFILTKPEEFVSQIDEKSVTERTESEPMLKNTKQDERESDSQQLLQFNLESMPDSSNNISTNNQTSTVSSIDYKTNIFPSESSAFELMEEVREQRLTSGEQLNQHPDIDSKVTNDWAEHEIPMTSKSELSQLSTNEINEDTESGCSDSNESNSNSKIDLDDHDQSISSHDTEISPLITTSEIGERRTSINSSTDESHDFQRDHIKVTDHQISATKFESLQPLHESEKIDDIDFLLNNEQQSDSQQSNSQYQSNDLIDIFNSSNPDYPDSNAPINGDNESVSKSEKADDIEFLDGNGQQSNLQSSNHITNIKNNGSNSKVQSFSPTSVSEVS